MFGAFAFFSSFFEGSGQERDLDTVMGKAHYFGKEHLERKKYHDRFWCWCCCFLFVFSPCVASVVAVSVVSLVVFALPFLPFRNKTKQKKEAKNNSQAKNDL